MNPAMSPSTCILDGVNVVTGNLGTSFPIRNLVVDSQHAFRIGALYQANSFSLRHHGAKTKTLC